jgi:hypothetical protein
LRSSISVGYEFFFKDLSRDAEEDESAVYELRGTTPDAAASHQDRPGMSFAREPFQVHSSEKPSNSLLAIISRLKPFLEISTGGLPQ